MACATRMLDEADIMTIPGIGFGESGDDFVRFALTVNVDRINDAAQRLARLKW